MARFSIVFVFVLSLGLGGQSWAQESEAPTVPTGDAAAADAEGVLPLEDLRTFAKIFNHIRSNYVEEVSDSELLEMAIRGMLEGLDPHSSYLDSDSFESLQVNTTGEFGGLGIEVGTENGFVKVISPIDNTPAERAGIQAGDLIIRLDNKPVNGMPLREAVDMMRGPKGSEITLTIKRDDVDLPFDVVLERDTIQVTSVRSRMLEPGYGYLRISQFQTHTGGDVLDALDDLKQSGPLEGLVLDLRNNPGGVLQASVDVADAFLDEGLIVYTEGRMNEGDMQFKAKPGDELGGVPMVVLVNQGSASASEIVAGALQDQHRAVIVGTDSFGKGSVQNVIPISEKSAIKLTTSLYFTPGGRSIQAQGIKPDIYVERAEVTAIKPTLATTEADLSNHLGNGNGGEESDTNARSTSDDPRAELLSRDNQLFEALSLLKGINVFGQSERAPITAVASTTDDTVESPAP